MSGQVPVGFVPDGFEPDESPAVNMQAVGGDTIRGEDPNAPNLLRRLQEALGHAAQPDSVGDFLSLIIPSGAGQAATDLKDMARIFRQAIKESPSLKGILPRINQIIKERPKTLQDFQSQGFNKLPLAQQAEHLPAIPAPPPRVVGGPPTLRSAQSFNDLPVYRQMEVAPPPVSTAPTIPPPARAPVETPPVAAQSAAPATAVASAGRTLTAEERQAVDLLVQQGHTEADVLAELDKLKQPSVKFTPKAVKLKMNAAETKEYLRLMQAGKTSDEAAEMVQAQRTFVTGKGLQDTATVKQRIRDRNASGRWED